MALSSTRHLINNPPTHHTIRVAGIIIPCPPINSHNNIIVLFRVLVHKFLPLLIEIIIIIITCPRMIYGVPPLLWTMSQLHPFKTRSHFRLPRLASHPFHHISHLAINVDHSNCPSIDIQPQDNNIKWI